jgi:hypothetical protein
VPGSSPAGTFIWPVLASSGTRFSSFFRLCAASTTIQCDLTVSGSTEEAASDRDRGRGRQPTVDVEVASPGCSSGRRRRCSRRPPPISSCEPMAPLTPAPRRRRHQNGPGTSAWASSSDPTASPWRAGWGAFHRRLCWDDGGGLLALEDFISSRAISGHPP